MPGVQRFVRLNLQGVIYEASENDHGDPVIRVRGEPLGDDEFELSDEEADNLMHFLEEFHDMSQGGQRVTLTVGQRGRSQQSRGDDDEDDDDAGQRRTGYRTTAYTGRGRSNERAMARNLDGSPDRRTGPRSADDTRGKVLDPEHDGRLRGNERYRPNDPDREGNREGGRRGARSGRNARRFE